MSSDVAIDVRNVSKRYDVYENPRDRLKQIVVPRLLHTAQRIGIARQAQPPVYHREFWALQELSFQVRAGETLGIIGRNGSGKSTLLQIIAGTLVPTHGEVAVSGRVAALLELGSGFNPEFTGRENVLLNARILGLNRDQIAERYDRIAAFADIGDFIDQPVKTYSSGMFVRLAFAVQAHIDASIVIIDEALAVGDVFFRQKCYTRLEEIRLSGAAVLLVSHAMTDIEQFCDHAILLDHGRMLFAGEAGEAAKRYYQLHQSASQTVFEPPAAGSPVIASDGGGSEIESWPDDSQFVSAEEVVQVGNGWARCTRFAVCNAAGIRSPSFEQGEEARFYSEFVVTAPMGVPLTGLVLQNDRGINVHGKGSLEYAAAAPHHVEAGTIIRCCQSVRLQLELGEYTFELGLATIDAATYTSMSTLNHEQIFSRIVRVCHLPKAGFLAVGWRRHHAGPPLTHHGLADLPGSFVYQCLRINPTETSR
ncbi:ABC transporter ATP-binding protein [Rhodopseudomonas palustris]|uniref:ABC transporter ATP-binding protein n=1 Tax=Rhodopseudomonas palustris TaxID=1076 RepID=UPI0006420FD3|nr:ABC transporter ATP-binding protein [Rhodopseudomonas palustris]